jgi:hypothetical protein
MRGSMDVDDAERLQRSEVAMVLHVFYILKTCNGVPCKVYNSVPVVLYLKPLCTTGCTDRE